MSETVVNMRQPRQVVYTVGADEVSELRCQLRAYLEAYPQYQKAAEGFFPDQDSMVTISSSEMLGHGEVVEVSAPTARLVAFVEKLRRHHLAQGDGR